MGKIRPERNSGLSASWTHDLCNTMQCPASWANKPTGSWSLCWFLMNLWSDEQMTVNIGNHLCELKIDKWIYKLSSLIYQDHLHIHLLVHSSNIWLYCIHSHLTVHVSYKKWNFCRRFFFHGDFLFCLQFLASIVTTYLVAYWNRHAFANNWSSTSIERCSFR